MGSFYEGFYSFGSKLGGPGLGKLPSEQTNSRQPSLFGSCLGYHKCTPGVVARSMIRSRGCFDLSLLTLPAPQRYAKHWPQASKKSPKGFCCTVLFSNILYHTILYSTLLYSTLLYYTILYCTVLYCTVLYYAILYCTVLYYTILY